MVSGFYKNKYKFQIHLINGDILHYKCKSYLHLWIRYLEYLKAREMKGYDDSLMIKNISHSWDNGLTWHDSDFQGLINSQPLSKRI